MSFSINTKIQRWGNGLGLRVSGPLRDVPQFTENSPVTVEVFEDGFTVKKATASIKHLPYTEDQLIAGLNSNTAHCELLALPIKGELSE